MKSIFLLLVTTLILLGCVPAKKYNDLLSKEKICSEELAKFKNAALDNEAKAKTLEARVAVLNKEVTNLKADTLEMGNKYRTLQAQFAKI